MKLFSWRLGLPLLGMVLIFLAPGTYGFNVYRLGGEGGNSWEATLSYEPGVYWVVGTNGTTTEEGRLQSPTIYPTWNDTLVEWVDSTGGEWLRPVWIPDTLNLARNGVRNRVQRGLSDNLATSGGCIDNRGEVDAIKPVFDGDPKTAAFFFASPAENPETRMGYFVQNVVVDLGTNYPVKRIRFFPRLGRDNPKIDEILERMAPPRLRKEELAEEDFSTNFLAWFEIGGANSIRNFADNCFWQTDASPWFQWVSHTARHPNSDPRWTILHKDEENLDVVVDLHFPVQLFQWVTFRPLFPLRNWEVAEFQVFGAGYIPRTVYTTAVLDFGENMAWGKIRWKGELDEGARVLIRTRSGTSPDPSRYWLATSIPGEFREGSREEYKRAPSSDRKIALDERHWSFWSSPYPWEVGLKDPDTAEHLWLDGSPILSPGPSRYFQIQVVLLSTLTGAGRLQDLEIQFSRPVAQEVVGEIWPLEVSRTKSATFTYSVRPTLFEQDPGFDHLEIFTLTRADTVRSVKVNAVEVRAQYPPQILEDRILVEFPRLQGDPDTGKLIEVIFDARVVRYGTEFQGWIFDGAGRGIKQLVKPGDASLAFPGNALGVRTEPLSAALLTQVTVSPNPFTPNGDGINEVAQFFFELHEVTVPRELSLRIYDLTGKRVRQFGKIPVVRGLFGGNPQDSAWDGMDEQGRKVNPGIYLYRLSLYVDGGTEERVGTLVVAY